MPQASSTVDKARALLEQRRSELQQELRQIESAITGLGGRKRGPGRPPGTGGTRRRRRRGGTRADQAVKLITDNPGIGVSELGKKMKLKAPNYLYRVLPDLEREGLVKKRGSGYHPG
jgi:sugar-specific transcriptional regulator TrmB